MKKLLLTLATAVLTLGSAMANEVTFDFSTAANASAYGIPTNKETYLTNPTEVVEGPVTITFSGSISQAWRWWDDGMRAYGNTTGKNPTMTVAVNGGTISEIVVNYNKTGATYSASTGTYTQASDNKSGTWEGSAASVKLTMTAKKNIAAAYTVTVTYTGGAASAVAAPKISCANNTVTITAEDADAVYYTTDGTEPSNASTKYSAPFTISQNTTVKAIAYKGTDKSNVTTYNAVYEGTFDGFAAFIAANTTGTVAGPISVLYQSSDRRYLYLKDSKDGYMLAYTSSSSNSNPTLANGDKLASITGKYSPYNSLPEMVPSAFGTVTKGDVVAPTEYTIEELSLEMANEYVVLKNASISGLNGKKFTITDETGTIEGYNSFGDIFTVTEGENFTIEGFVCRYNTTLQFTPCNITGGTIMEPVETPVISPESGVVAAGTEITITCATADATIFYTTDGTAPTASSTMYEGAFTISESTTVKAIAVKEGMADSNVATAEYTIAAVGTTIVTFDFNKDGNALSLSSNPNIVGAGNDVPEGKTNQLEGVKFINGHVTMWVEQGTATNPGRWWAGTSGDTELRFYKLNTLYISVNTNGYKIESITFPKGFGTSFVNASTVGTTTPDNGTWDYTKRSWTPAANAVVTDFVWAPGATVNCGAVEVVLKEDSSATTGVSNISANDENAAPEYYNLQGVRVMEPAAGNLYIERRGTQVRKVVIR